MRKPGSPKPDPFKEGTLERAATLSPHDNSGKQALPGTVNWGKLDPLSDPLRKEDSLEEVPPSTKSGALAVPHWKRASGERQRTAQWGQLQLAD